MIAIQPRDEDEFVEIYFTGYPALRVPKNMPAIPSVEPKPAFEWIEAFDDDVGLRGD
jgi:hypothetical protein